MPISIVFLTGCEHLPVNNGNTIPSSDSVPTKFSAVKSETPEGNQMENAPSLAVQDIKKLAASWGANTEVLTDNFFSAQHKTQAPNITLGKPMDFDNIFSDQNQSQTTTIFTSVNNSSVDVVTPVSPVLKGSWGSGAPVDFDNFFSDTVASRHTPDIDVLSGKPIDFDNFFSIQTQTQTQFDTKKQAKIKAINKETVVLLKNNAIAEQVRNKDVDTQLEFEFEFEFEFELRKNYQSL